VERAVNQRRHKSFTHFGTKNVDNSSPDPN
jgi:hypothetical protein